MDSDNKRFILAEKIILITGIFLVVFSFISEFHFHFLQGFMPENVPSDIFWRAEAAEVLNSMTFLILGIILLIIPFILSKRRRREQ
ncbi:MAG: hypothetical protein BAJALOKI1v1_1400010 [Promethearchaeota archaeon]|nr:MAG: hypothetical protein BAJALOKI1v1_1400010 [Candidatus Lokiarchaeota archaeon]